MYDFLTHPILPFLTIPCKGLTVISGIAIPPQPNLEHSETLQLIQLLFDWFFQVSGICSFLCLLLLQRTHRFHHLAPTTIRKFLLTTFFWTWRRDSFDVNPKKESICWDGHPWSTEGQHCLDNRSLMAICWEGLLSYSVLGRTSELLAFHTVMGCLYHLSQSLHYLVASL